MFTLYFNRHEIGTINGVEASYNAYSNFKQSARDFNALLELIDAETGELVISYDGENDEEFEY